MSFGICVWEREREREKENNKIKIENCNEILFLYINTYKVKVYSMLNSIIDDVIFVCRICANTHNVLEKNMVELKYNILLKKFTIKL